MTPSLRPDAALDGLARRGQDGGTAADDVTPVSTTWLGNGCGPRTGTRTQQRLGSEKGRLARWSAETAARQAPPTATPALGRTRGKASSASKLDKQQAGRAGRPINPTIRPSTGFKATNPPPFFIYIFLLHSLFS
jgi:hypothetical protein